MACGMWIHVFCPITQHNDPSQDLRWCNQTSSALNHWTIRCWNHMHVQWKLPVPCTSVAWQFLHDLHVSLALQCIFEPLIPLQTHLKSNTNNVTVNNAAASTLPQTSEVLSSTQQSLVNSPAQEQPAPAQTQELSSRDTMDRPGPSHVRTYNLHVHDCIMYHSELKLILITFYPLCRNLQQALNRTCP